MLFFELVSLVLFLISSISLLDLYLDLLVTLALTFSGEERGGGGAGGRRLVSFVKSDGMR